MSPLLRNLLRLPVACAHQIPHTFLSQLSLIQVGIYSMAVLTPFLHLITGEQTPLCASPALVPPGHYGTCPPALDLPFTTTSWMTRAHCLQKVYLR